MKEWGLEREEEMESVGRGNATWVETWGGSTVGFVSG